MTAAVVFTLVLTTVLMGPEIFTGMTSSRPLSDAASATPNICNASTGYICFGRICYQKGMMCIPPRAYDDRRVISDGDENLPLNSSTSSKAASVFQQNITSPRASISVSLSISSTSAPSSYETDGHASEEVRVTNSKVNKESDGENRPALIGLLSTFGLLCFIVISLGIAALCKRWNRCPSRNRSDIQEHLQLELQEYLDEFRERPLEYFDSPDPGVVNYIRNNGFEDQHLLIRKRGGLRFGANH